MEMLRGIHLAGFAFDMNCMPASSISFTFMFLLRGIHLAGFAFDMNCMPASSISFTFMF